MHTPYTFFTTTIKTIIMRDNVITRNYLAELSAVLIDTKIIVQNQGDNICVHKREYYKKRNGKTCYVDSGTKYYPTDWSRIRTYKNHKTYSTGENDWNPLHITNTSYKFLDGYKEELIAEYSKQQQLK